MHVHVYVCTSTHTHPSPSHTYKKLTNGFPIVPASMVHPLSDQLYGRLGSIHLQCWHVQIINKEYLSFSKGRTKHSFTPGSACNNDKIRKINIIFVYSIMINVFSIRVRYDDPKLTEYEVNRLVFFA